MTATFHVGDAIEVMSTLPENSVDLILTSPPFLALRSYLPADHPDKGKEGGSQSTPGEFIDWLLDVAEACNRVLAPHGSLCIELGDTYAGGGGWGDYPDAKNPNRTEFDKARGKRAAGKPGKLSEYSDARGNPDGMRDTTFSGGTGWPLAKSLSLIPESFRFAMVYGFNPHTGRTTEPWRLRNVIRWVRPNPPVGALGDKFRPATSELMVFCKSAKRYFDLDAVREPFSDKTNPSLSPARKRPDDPQRMRRFGPQINTHSGAPPLDWWELAADYNEVPEHPHSPRGLAANGDGDVSGSLVPERSSIGQSAGAPPLDWWNIPPGGYEGAHYAVFPPELCVKPVKAMCPEKVCRVCGEPSRRIVSDEVRYVKPDGRAARVAGYESNDSGAMRQNITGFDNGNYRAIRDTLGFSDCGHDDWRPGVVLDPFAGSGTTLAVATGHGRDAIGIDLDERNYELALQRVGPFILERAS